MMVGFPPSSSSSIEAVDSVSVSVSESEEESMNRGEEGFLVSMVSLVGVGTLFVVLEVERGVVGFSFLNKEWMVG